MYLGMRRLLLGLRALLFSDCVERELDEEMQFHIDMQVEQLVRRGMTESQARDVAVRSFGNRARHKERAREGWYLAGLGEFLQDLRYGVRSLRHRPAFAAITLLVLALGIGVNTTIFSAVNAVLLQAPPYGDPDQLVFIWRTNEMTQDRLQVAAPDVAAYRMRSDVLQGIAFAANATDGMLQTGAGSHHVRVGLVSPNLFRVLDVPATIGRTFYPGEGQLPSVSPGDSSLVPPPSAAILSHGFWLSRMGGDTTAIGRTLTVNGQALTVVGVLPRWFALRTPPDVGFGDQVDVWTPLRVSLGDLQRVSRRRDLDSDNTGIAIARLASGATFTAAQSALDAVAARQRALSPAYREARSGVRVVPLVGDLIAHAKPALVALQGAVCLVLLVACLNVATMLAARGSSRRRELAVRAALGASRGRLLRQLLTESLLLAIVAGALGIALSALANPVLGRLSAVALPEGADLRLDRTVLAFTVLLSVVAALVAGVMPAIVNSRRGLIGALHHRNATGDPTRTAMGLALVVAQIALSVALLSGAGLLLESFTKLQQVDPGFEPAGLLAFNLNLSVAGLPGPAERARFVHEVEQRVRGLPGVQTVGLTNAVPLSGREWTQPYGIEGQGEAEWERNRADFRMITSEYLTAMGIPLVAGRTFTADEDLNERDRVALVDVTLANQIAPQGDAIGRVMGFPLDGAPVWAEIVGIVGRVRHSSLKTEGRATIYVPYRQEASRSVAMVVRTSREGTDFATELRRELNALDTTVPVFDFTLMQRRVDEALAPSRFVLILVAAFAVLALVLAASGLYGLLSYTVQQRTRELGVRLALGAQKQNVVGAVLARGMLLAAAGLLVGIPLSILTSRALSSLLYAVNPADYVTRVAVALILACVAALACYVPARRASRVDPMAALRAE